MVKKRSRVLSLLLAFMLAAGLLPGVVFSAFAAPNDAVNIPDPDFAAAVREIVKKPVGEDILESDVAELTGLDISNRGIADLTGIEKFSALEWLYCDNNRLFAADLSELTKLTYVNGEYQNVSLALSSAEETPGEYSAPIALNSPTFDNEHTGYADGILTSTNPNMYGTWFEVQTDLAGFTLSGQITLSYPADGERLPAPANVRWSAEYPGRIDFDVDTEAAGIGAISRFQVYLSKNGLFVSSFTTPYRGNKKMSIDAGFEITDSGIYQAVIFAESANTDFADSLVTPTGFYPYTRPSNELLPPANPHWDPGKTLTALWEPVDRVSRYHIVVRATEPDGRVLTSGTSISASDTSFDVLKSLYQGTFSATASYRFAVWAVSGSIETLATGRLAWSDTFGNANQIADSVAESLNGIDGTADSEAIKEALSAINKTDLEFAIKTGDPGTLERLAELEEAFSESSGVEATVVPDKNLAEKLGDLNQIKVLGAAFNSKSGGNVALNITAPTATPEVGGNYMTGALFVDIKLTESGQEHGSLDFPIQITMPKPPGFTNAMHILHYGPNGSVETIYPRIDGGNISFTVTSFSVFAFVEPSDDGGDGGDGGDGDDGSDNGNGSDSDNGNGGGGTPAAAAQPNVKQVISPSGKATVALQDGALAELGTAGSIVLSVAEKTAAAAVLDELAAIDAVNRQLAGTVYTASAASNGQKTSDAYQLYRLSLDVSGTALTAAQKEKLSGVYLDAAGAYKNLGGELSADGKTFTFYGSRAGDYTVIVSDSLRKVIFTVDSGSFTVNGETRQNDAAPVIREGRTLLPLRAVGEAMGAEVVWSDAARTVTVTKDGKSVNLTVDQPLPGGQGSALILEGRTLAPIRYAAQMLDCNISWDEATGSVNIYA